MSGGGWGLALVLLAYVALVLVLGLVAARRSARSPEEYYLAGRTLGTAVLFMALFGTNVTSFVLVAVPGLAYHDGVGIFGVNAPIVALGIPLTLWAIGSPARAMAARLGALTPAELFARRLDSPAVGRLLFLFFTLYTLPYMVQAVAAVGLALEVASDGAVPDALGSLGVLVVALVYTSLGGMRATAWTNVVQGALFMLFMLAAFFGVAASLGGLSAATAAVERVAPELLVVDRTGAYGAGHGRYYPPGMWTTWGLLISLTVIGFPHMLARVLAAGSESSLRNVARFYPLALAALWLPAVMLGVWGRGAFPGLVGAESDRIFSLMVGSHLPAWLGVVGVLAVLAAVMSTLDAQLLTLASMLVRDALPGRAVSVEGQLRAARLFAVLLAALVYVLSQSWTESLYQMSALAFSGYVTLVPTLFLGVRWRGFTARGAIASMLAGNLVLVAAEAALLPDLGVVSVTWALPAAVVAGVLGSRSGRRPEEGLVRAAFGEARTTDDNKR